MTGGPPEPADRFAGLPEPADPTESTGARLNRNWHDLLQELRVTQTGVQILTGFLLILPFSPGFDELAHSRRILYCVVLAAAVVAALAVMTPVVLHRSLFRAGEKGWLVDAAHRAALAGSGILACALLGAFWLIVDHVLTTLVATALVALFVLTVLGLWVLLPLRARLRGA